MQFTLTITTTFSSGCLSMKIKCLHGFFIMEETKLGQVSDFTRRYGLSIVPYQDKYTFEQIKDSPRYSLNGKAYLNRTTSKNFEGEPWQVYEANGLVYNFSSGLLVPIDSITGVVELKAAGNKFLSNGLILPGSLTDAGERIRDYSAWFSRDTLRFAYSEVTYV